MTFDQLQFIVDFNSYDNLKLDFIKIMKGPVIPDVKAISDTVYLEKWDVASGYTLDANKDDIIAWEFRTYDNPFIVYFRCQDPKIISHDKTANKGRFRALVSMEFRFSFENIGDTGGGYLEFEIKIMKIIDGYNVLILFGIISIISVVSIKRLTTFSLKKIMRQRLRLSLLGIKRNQPDGIAGNFLLSLSGEIFLLGSTSSITSN